MMEKKIAYSSSSSELSIRLMNLLKDLGWRMVEDSLRVFFLIVLEAFIKFI